MMFKKIAQVFFCSSFFSYIIYLRLFRWGNIREITTDLLLAENYYRIAVILGIIVSLLITLYIKFSVLYEKESKFKFKLIERTVEMLDNAFMTFFKLIDWFTDKCGLKFKHLINSGLYLNRILNTETKIYVFVYLTYVLPRFIYTLIFMMDIFVFQELNNTFKFSGLLLIPFIARYVEKLHNHMVMNTCKIMDTIFFIINLDTNEKYTTYEYLAILLESAIFEKNHGIKNPAFEFHAQFQKELEDSVRYTEDGVYIEFDAKMEKELGVKLNDCLEANTSVYLNQIKPLYVFNLEFFFGKKTITQYSDILFSISYIIIWTSILFIRI